MLSRRTSFLLSACAIIALALNVNPLYAATIGVVVDDSFADGDRAKPALLMPTGGHRAQPAAATSKMTLDL